MAQSLWIRVLVTITALIATSLAGPEQPDRQSTPNCIKVAQDLKAEVFRKLKTFAKATGGQLNQPLTPKCLIEMPIGCAALRIKGLLKGLSVRKFGIELDGNTRFEINQLYDNGTNQATINTRLNATSVTSEYRLETTLGKGHLDVSYKTHWKYLDVEMTVTFLSTSDNAKAVILATDVKIKDNFKSKHFYPGNNTLLSCIAREGEEAAKSFLDWAVEYHAVTQKELITNFLKQQPEKWGLRSC